MLRAQECSGTVQFLGSPKKGHMQNTYLWSSSPLGSKRAYTPRVHYLSGFVHYPLVVMVHI